jgi:replicative DNA helicase
VSVAEVAQRGEEFERMPPHDVAAEQCALGGMLLSKDAISDVIEVIRPTDHYRPAHQLVHEAILDLYARGEPADPITVANELTRRGELARIGGAPYLHTLIASVPTAANAGYYARIVRERAILRRLVEAGTRIVQFGYAGDADADDLVDRAQAEVYAVTDRRIAEDYHSLSEIMPGALDEIEAIGAHGGGITGVPTGFADLDALTNGLHPGQMVVIAARPAVGKALALDTPLPTPTGWTTMGDVQVGDYLIGADGKPTKVLAATGVMTGRPCYEVEFSDGTIIVADAEHQWRTTTRASRRQVASWAKASHCSIVTTREIAGSLRTGRDNRYNHAVAVAGPADLPERDLPLPPYTLGAWLGDGRTEIAQITTVDPEIVAEIESEGIPPEYLRASEPQRRALLAGLLDTVGYANKNGTVQFAVTRERLARDTHELVLSLGYQATLTSKPVPGHTLESSTCYIVTFTPGDPVFRLPRKLARQRETTQRTRNRYITDVRPCGSVPVRCVEVDSRDHMYLAGPTWIPTHNSALALDFARSATIRHQMPTVVFSLEMGRNEITMRLLSAEARVPMHVMRTGQMSDDDWARLARRMSEVADAPLFIDDSPNMSLMEIRAKCRRLKQRHDLKLVIIDYLQLMSSPKRVESRQQEVSEMSRSLKLLAKELEVPVVALSQLNRGPEQRQDKKPMLSDLRESGCLTGDTRILRADTGAEVTLDELMASGERDIPVWSLDERMRLVPRTLTHAFSSGIKEVFRVRLASGRELQATANHPFLTYDGWKPLGELATGSRVAIPRSTPSPLNERPLPEAEIIMLAHLLGDGPFVKHQPIRYASTDEENLASNPVAEWLDSLGLFGLRSHEKFVPEPVFSLPKEQLALFLRHLWATDGSVTVAKSGNVRIYYGTTSERFARQLQMLLLRFGIVARFHPTGNTRGRPLWTVDVTSVDDQAKFVGEIGVHGARAVNVAQVRVRLDLNIDICPSRSRLGRIAQVLEDRELEMLATNDVFWDTVISIESIGEFPVYDATVLETHNFVANGTNIHNSIEQDADVVILLHREDAYERESPRAGEADLIVAKHRNGPTATVTVAFQGHYSRFVDMAPG